MVRNPVGDNMNDLLVSMGMKISIYMGDYRQKRDLLMNNFIKKFKISSRNT